MDALFHIGLHKTGTTSFQRALMLARDTLRLRGILYPEPPQGAAFTDQHADIPLMLRAGRHEEVGTYLQSVAASARACTEPPIHRVLFSSEEFSNLCYDEAALKAFRHIGLECFGSYRVIAAVRSVIEIAASNLRQLIDGGSLVASQLASEKVVLDVLLSVPRKLAILTSLGPITVIDYYVATQSGDLNNYLARACFGDDAPTLQNLRLNVSTDRDERLAGLLLSQMRSLLATLRQSHPYADDVNTALSELIDIERLKEIIKPTKCAEFARVYERKVMDIVSATCQKHYKTVIREVAGLPEDFQRPLLRSSTDPGAHNADF